MQQPPKPGPYEDRHLDCQAALEDDFGALVDAAVASGWDRLEAVAAIIALAENHALQIAANVETERQIAEAIGRRRR